MAAGHLPPQRRRDAHSRRTRPDHRPISYRIRSRTRRQEFPTFLKTLRTSRPGETLYVVRDSFSPHHHTDVRTWCADNQVESVFVPTYSSWLNWIESEFAALRYFALNGTDHRTHAEQNAAIAAFIRRRNARARPKAGFATDSPIRTWTDYPAKLRDKPLATP